MSRHLEPARSGAQSFVIDRPVVRIAAAILLLLCAVLLWILLPPSAAAAEARYADVPGSPAISGVVVDPLDVERQRNGTRERCQVTYTVSEPVRTRVTVRRPDDTRVRTVRDWRWVPAATLVATWDGRIDVAGRRIPAPDGQYLVRIEAIDVAGEKVTEVFGITCVSDPGTPGDGATLVTAATRNFRTRYGRRALFRFRVFYVPALGETARFSRARVTLRARDDRGRVRYSRTWSRARLNRTYRHVIRRCRLAPGRYTYCIYARLSDGTRQQVVGQGRFTVRRRNGSVPRRTYRHVGTDRSLHCDLVRALPSAPQAVVFGGSRAMRFPASELTERAGLDAFNAAFHNGRFVDFWAFSKYLFRRSPNSRPACLFAVAPTSFSDKDLHPGLLYDSRLSRSLPRSLVRQQRRKQGRPPRVDLLRKRRYNSRGRVVWNHYDRPSYRRLSLKRRLDRYIRNLLPAAGRTRKVKQSRSIAYFERTVRLYNDHGVTPVVVIMPYHPRVLRAFRDVGWQKKVDRLLALLADSQTRVDFEVVDLLEIDSFGGDPNDFYDGSHVKIANCKRIIRHVVETVPHCFE